MRYVNISLGCDWTDCGTVAPEGDGVVIERTLDGRTFNICKEHNEALDEILSPLLKAGTKVTGKKRSLSTVAAGSAPVSAAEHEIPCKECEATPKRKIGLAQHVIKTHGYESLAEYEARHQEAT